MIEIIHTYMQTNKYTRTLHWTGILLKSIVQNRAYPKAAFYDIDNIITIQD